ncbi:outer membrane beta-barrel protein [Arachidicoccus terrestris]|uniref:outer membrane beta-barrel protein n=1 Tax=Arachidicoccus terrestris TaxID=2875539 RepID=UPI001CC3F9B9|nr:hypothetical protein [Arachidicoccus terrestris]UAY54746.1 hypothetical protein K9M52_15050 [Arachidicoccus terrestris]
MKILNKIAVLSLALVLGLTINAKAQTAPERSGIQLSVGPQANLPLGSFKDAYDWSIGGSVQADFPVLKNDLYVVVNAGYNNFFAKEGAGTGKDLGVIPVSAGLKYYFPSTNLYVQGTAGVGFLTSKDDVAADKSASFTYSPQVGYLLNLGGRNALDIAVKFEGDSKIYDNGKSSNFLGLRVAYNLGL